jgi:hypothetical protein
LGTAFESVPEGMTVSFAPTTKIQLRMVVAKNQTNFSAFLLTTLPAARSINIRQKAKSTLKLPKWVDGAGAENQKATEDPVAW